MIDEIPTAQVRTTVSERLTVYTGKSQKRNLSIFSQFKRNLNEDTNENNSDSNLRNLREKSTKRKINSEIYEFPSALFESFFQKKCYGKYEKF